MVVLVIQEEAIEEIHIIPTMAVQGVVVAAAIMIITETVLIEAVAHIEALVPVIEEIVDLGPVIHLQQATIIWIVILVLIGHPMEIQAMNLEIVILVRLKNFKFFELVL